MTRIVLVRHGSTDWNKEGRAQGSTDIPLNSEGLKQAARLAERLGGEEWDAIYSSDLSRARETAEIVAEAAGGLPVMTEERLREAAGGQIEGTTEAERVAKWGTGWRKLDLHTENAESTGARGMEAIEEIAGRHPGGNVLVVSHGAFNRHLLRKLVPGFKAEEPLGNTSVTTVIRTQEEWVCDLYNCTRHLEAEIEDEEI